VLINQSEEINDLYYSFMLFKRAKLYGARNGKDAIKPDVFLLHVVQKVGEWSAKFNEEKWTYGDNT